MKELVIIAVTVDDEKRLLLLHPAMCSFLGRFWSIINPRSSVI
jgi:hypothetical protein